MLHEVSIDSDPRVGFEDCYNRTDCVDGNSGQSFHFSIKYADACGGECLKRNNAKHKESENGLVCSIITSAAAHLEYVLSIFHCHYANKYACYMFVIP